MTRIITRAEWGARQAKTTPRTIATPTPELWLHHAAGAVLPGDDTVSDQDLNRIRAIQKYHMDTRGWNDIAYSFLSDPDGNIFEGRGPGISGAHTKGHNSISHGICVMGNYNTQPVDSDLIPRLADFVRFGHGQGWWPNQLTGGHKDVGSTSCPGHNLYPLISEINRQTLEDEMTPEQLQEGLAEFFEEITQTKRDGVVRKHLVRISDSVWTAEVGRGDQREFLSSVLVQSRNYSKADFLNGDAEIPRAELVAAIADAIEEANLTESMLDELAARLTA